MTEPAPVVRPSRFYYYLGRNPLLWWLKVWERFEAHGSEQIPATGGCIVASNHVSYLDPPVIAGGVKNRIVRFMARDTLFRWKPMGWFLLKAQCVPIDRTRGDVGALRKGIQILREGDLLALFPEGTRSPDGELKPAKGGMGFLIAKAGVPVVPAYVDGSYKAFPKNARFVKPGKVRVFFGPPIPFAEFAQLGQDRDSYEKIGQLVMARIAALKPTG